MFFVGLFVGVSLVSVVSAVPPDTNNNGCVSITELSNYVSLWLNNSGITLSQVSVGVSWWLNGCVPVVSILSPVNNSQYYSGSNITINVSASDADGSILYVEFYRGTSTSGTILSNDSNSPYICSWNNVQLGNYTITVIAYGNSGMSTRATSFVRVISAPEVCGNGVCSVSETCSSCPQDCGVCPVLGSSIIIDYNSIKKFNTIPSCAITNAKQDLHIDFSHTSHGSQIPSGMNAMRTYNSMYNYSSTGGVNTLHFEDYSSRNVE
jgi:hypothetical protein